MWVSTKFDGEGQSRLFEDGYVQINKVIHLFLLLETLVD